jgi:hypothetical protein
LEKKGGPWIWCTWVVDCLLMWKCWVYLKNKTNINSCLLGFSDTLRVLYYEKNEKCWEAQKKLFAVFFSFCYNSCWGSRILLKFCMSNLGVKRWFLPIFL